MAPVGTCPHLPSPSYATDTIQYNAIQYNTIQYNIDPKPAADIFSAGLTQIAASFQLSLNFQGRLSA